MATIELSNNYKVILKYKLIGKFKLNFQKSRKAHVSVTSIIFIRPTLATNHQQKWDPTIN